MDPINDKDAILESLVFDEYNSRGHELNLSETIENAVDSGQDLFALANQLAQEIGPLGTDIVTQEPSTASPISASTEEIAQIILQYADKYKMHRTGSKEWWCLTCGESKSPEAMEECHSKGHKLEVLDKTADTNQSSEGDIGASGDVQENPDSTRTSGGEDNAEVVRMQTGAVVVRADAPSGGENTAPLNLLLAKAFTLAGFKYDVDAAGDVGMAKKTLSGNREWQAVPNGESRRGPRYILALWGLSEDGINGKLFAKYDILIDKDWTSAIASKKILQITEMGKQPTVNMENAPEDLSQVTTLNPAQISQRRDQLLDQLNAIPEDDPRRNQIKEQLKSLGRLLRTAKEREEPRSNGDTDGLYLEWSDSLATDWMVEGYIEQLGDGLPTNIKGNIASGWEKEPWMLQDTKFAESYKVAYSPEEWLKNIREQGLMDELEDALREKAYEDSDGASWAWEGVTEDLSQLMDTVNPDSSVWRVNMRGFGWLSQDNDGTVTAKTGSELLQAILPNTQCSFKVYKQGRGIVINNAHHDKPMGGEMYYISPFDATPPNPPETPVERQYAQAPELADSIKQEHEERKQRSRPKEVNSPPKITPQQLENAPETVNDITTLSPKQISDKRNTLLDKLNTLPEGDPQRNKIMEQIRSLGKRKDGQPIAEGVDPQGKKLQLLELEETMATRGRYVKWLLVDAESGTTLQEAGPLYLDDPTYNDAALNEARHNAYKFLMEQTMGNSRDLRAAKDGESQHKTEGGIMSKKKILQTQVSGMKLTMAQKAIVADMESHIEDYTEEFLNTMGQIMKQDWDPGSSWQVVEADGIAKLVRRETPLEEPDVLSKHSYREGQELRIDAGILPEDVVVVALLGEKRYKVQSAFTGKVFPVDESDLYDPKEDGIFTDGTGLSIGDIANLF